MASKVVSKSMVCPAYLVAVAFFAFDRGIHCKTSMPIENEHDQRYEIRAKVASGWLPFTFWSVVGILANRGEDGYWAYLLPQH